MSRSYQTHQQRLCLPARSRRKFYHFFCILNVHPVIPPRVMACSPPARLACSSCSSSAIRYIRFPFRKKVPVRKKRNATRSSRTGSSVPAPRQNRIRASAPVRRRREPAQSPRSLDTHPAPVFQGAVRREFPYGAPAVLKMQESGHPRVSESPPNRESSRFHSRLPSRRAVL